MLISVPDAAKTRHSAAIADLCKARKLESMNFRQNIRAALCYEMPDVEGMTEESKVLITK